MHALDESALAAFVDEALSIESVKTAHFFRRPGVGHVSGVVYDAGCDVEFDVRQTSTGWNVNDDLARDFEAKTLHAALVLAIKAQ